MIHTLHEIVWGPWLLFAFLGTGIYYTVVFRFFQVRKLKYWLGETLGSMGKGENREEKPWSGGRRIWAGCRKRGS